MVGSFLTTVLSRMLLQLIPFGPIRGSVSSSSSTLFSNPFGCRENSRKEKKILEFPPFSSLSFGVAKGWKTLSKRSTWLVGGLSFLGFIYFSFPTLSLLPK